MAEGPTSPRNLRGRTRFPVTAAPSPLPAPPVKRPMVSKLTLLGYAITAWSGVVATSAIALGLYDVRLGLVGGLVAFMGATGGLATAIVGAARHDMI